MSASESFFMEESSGTAVQPTAWPMPMVMNSMWFVEPDVDGTGVPGRHAADGAVRPRQVLLVQLGHARRDASTGRWQHHAADDVEPGTCDRHGAPLSAAVPDRRDSVWQPDHECPASSQLLYGDQRSVLPQRGRACNGGSVLRGCGRSGVGASRVSASCVGNGDSAGDAWPSLAGFHSHRQQRTDGCAGVSTMVRFEASGFYGTRARRKSLDDRLRPDEFLLRAHHLHAHAALDRTGVGGTLDASRNA